jgi:hypothetical protein
MLQRCLLRGCLSLSRSKDESARDSASEVVARQDAGAIVAGQVVGSVEPKSASPEAADGKAFLSPRVYICRAAVLFLRMPDKTDSLFTGVESARLSAEVETRLRRAFDADPRVTELIKYDGKNVQNARTITAWQVEPNANVSALTMDSFQVLRLNREFMFRVRVPIKNQPLYRGLDDVPTDEYLAVWDGVSLSVQWLQDAPHVSGSGGHVVFKVLQDIVEAAGYAAIPWACASGCHHYFLHADFVTFDSESAPDHFCHSGKTPVAATIITPYSMKKSDVANLRRTHGELAGLIGEYAEARTNADAIRSVSEEAMSRTQQMTALAYARAARRRFPHPGMIRDVWNLRSARRQTQEIISGLWLALTFLSTRRSIWRRERALLMKDLSDRRFSDLADSFDADEDLEQEFDIDLIRASLEHNASDLAAGALLVATALGAVAVVLGTILGFFLS